MMFGKDRLCTRLRELNVENNYQGQIQESTKGVHNYFIACCWSFNYYIVLSYLNNNNNKTVGWH